MLQAIERTFRGVSKAFASVFSELVPAGRGRLIIQRKTDRSTAQDDEDSEDEQARKSVENYTGVGISVSFNSKHDDQQRIQQLSGGQKSKYQQFRLTRKNVLLDSFLKFPYLYVPKSMRNTPSCSCTTQWSSNTNTSISRSLRTDSHLRHPGLRSCTISPFR